ncbi:hypothetical protein EDB85DRAFT_1888854 [Lactarius pseudohatsudake]|nr:hypothetical protein EDB85DRAFT_1888854 [Lactarius pseudohatsudake]
MAVMADRITKRGRVVYHFKTFNSAISVLVEVEWEIGVLEWCLDAIAQVIVECNVCSWNNSKDGFNVPVYGILCDGHSFLFFTFDGSTKPYKLTMGSFPGTHHFICSLRPICKTIFNLLLLAYIASLKAYHDRDASQQKSLDGWDKALKFAEE